MVVTNRFESITFLMTWEVTDCKHDDSSSLISKGKSRLVSIDFSVRLEQRWVERREHTSGDSIPTHSQWEWSRFLSYPWERRATLMAGREKGVHLSPWTYLHLVNWDVRGYTVRRIEIGTILEHILNLWIESRIADNVLVRQELVERRLHLHGALHSEGSTHEVLRTQYTCGK